MPPCHLDETIVINEEDVAAQPSDGSEVDDEVPSLLLRLTERQIATNPAKFVKNFGEKRFATSHVDSFQNAVRSKLILGTEY